MKSQLEKELALVRGLVEEFLEDDPFPETVRPPALREAVRLYPLRGGKTSQTRADPLELRRGRRRSGPGIERGGGRRNLPQLDSRP